MLIAAVAFMATIVIIGQRSVRSSLYASNSGHGCCCCHRPTAPYLREPAAIMSEGDHKRHAACTACTHLVDHTHNQADDEQRGKQRDAQAHINLERWSAYAKPPNRSDKYGVLWPLVHIRDEKPLPDEPKRRHAAKFPRLPHTADVRTCDAAECDARGSHRKHTPHFEFSAQLGTSHSTAVLDPWFGMAMAVTGAAVAYVGAVLCVFVVVAGGKPIVRERWCCWVHTAVQCFC